MLPSVCHSTLNSQTGFFCFLFLSLFLGLPWTVLRVSKITRGAECGGWLLPNGVALNIFWAQT